MEVSSFFDSSLAEVKKYKTKAFLVDWIFHISKLCMRPQLTFFLSKNNQGNGRMVSFAKGYRVINARKSIFTLFLYDPMKWELIIKQTSILI